MDETKRIMRQLIQLDRLPKENTLEGLLILKSAWNDHDVTHLPGLLARCPPHSPLHLCTLLTVARASL